MATSIWVSAGAWAWQQYGKDVIDQIARFTSDSALMEKWRKFGWDKATQKYQEWLLHQHQTIRILGKPTPVLLEGIYTDVYVLDQLTSRRYRTIEELKNEPLRHNRQMHRQRKDGLYLVNQSKNLLILGQPGAGKTTFLRYVTLQALKGTLNKIPVFVSLKEWSISAHEEIMPFLKEQFSVCDFPDAQPFIDYLLQNGLVIVLFDGLDEVGVQGNQRYTCTQILNDFAKQYPNCQILITCRVSASDYQFEQFQDVEIADFTRNQIDNFVINWFGENNAKKAAFFEDFGKPNNAGLRELASVPLLLTLLCLAFEESMEFPKKRSELYQEALDALLKKWDSSRNIQRDELYRMLSLRDKNRMFSHIAAETFEEGRYFFQQEWLVARIEQHLDDLLQEQQFLGMDGSYILQAITSQHGIFTERARSIYAFSHLTFQEYYAAKYIVDNEARGTVQSLIDNHLTHSNWREVITLTSSMLDEADDFLVKSIEAVHQIIEHDEELVEIVRSIHEISRQDLSSRAANELFFSIMSKLLMDMRRNFVSASIDNSRSIIAAINISRTVSISSLYVNTGRRGRDSSEIESIINELRWTENLEEFRDEVSSLHAIFINSRDVSVQELAIDKVETVLSLLYNIAVDLRTVLNSSMMEQRKLAEYSEVEVDLVRTISDLLHRPQSNANKVNIILSELNQVAREFGDKFDHFINSSIYLGKSIEDDMVDDLEGSLGRIQEIEDNANSALIILQAIEDELRKEQTDAQYSIKNIVYDLERDVRLEKALVMAITVTNISVQQIDMDLNLESLRRETFTLNQIEQLTVFLESSRLLMACLPLSYLRSRSYIEERLLNLETRSLN